jgi:hypothetical protein
LLGLFFYPEEGSDKFLHVLSKIYGITTQTTILFIVTAMRTSHPSSFKNFLYISVFKQKARVEAVDAALDSPVYACTPQ